MAEFNKFTPYYETKDKIWEAYGQGKMTENDKAYYIGVLEGIKLVADLQDYGMGFNEILNKECEVIQERLKGR